MAIPNAWGGIVDGSFHVIASGEMDSFLEKYGDLEDSMSLCKWKVSPAAKTTISDVLGVSRSNKDVMWEANGCRGSVDFE